MSSLSVSPCSTHPEADANPSPGPIFDALPKTGNVLFDQAVAAVFHQEGFYTDDKADKGGPTKYGISLKLAKSLGLISMDINHDGIVDINDIRLLTPEKAIEVYRDVFWQPYPYQKLSPFVGLKMFSLTVNMGAHQSHILLQRALRACGGPAISEDGVFGPQTLNGALMMYQPSLIASLRSEAAGFYRLLVSANPPSRKYIKGWLNRAYF